MMRNTHNRLRPVLWLVETLLLCARSYRVVDADPSHIELLIWFLGSCKCACASVECTDTVL